jgi:ribosomal subunit interface protein
MVSTKVHFNNNLSKTEALESFARSKVEQALERFDENIEGTIHLHMENAPGKPGLDCYRCEIELQSRKLRKVVLKKAGPNMYQAIARAATALKSLASRLHERSAFHKRTRTSVKNAVRSFPQLVLES